MKPLHIIAFGKYLDEEGYQMIYQSFKELYKGVTPKHRKRMRLFIVDDFENNAQIWNRAAGYDIEEAITILNKDLDELEEIMRNGSALFMPGDRIPVRLISRAFSYGLPIIGYHQLQDFDLVDQTCSMLVRYRDRYQTITEFTQMLRILYFDPEVRKILKRGTIQKYNSQFRWGIRERV
ncbi:MAG: hypothetical protein AAF985_05325 [Bacteroidota bacterium]